MNVDLRLLIYFRYLEHDSFPDVGRYESSHTVSLITSKTGIAFPEALRILYGKQGVGGGGGEEVQQKHNKEEKREKKALSCTFSIGMVFYFHSPQYLTAVIYEHRIIY